MLANSFTDNVSLTPLLVCRYIANPLFIPRSPPGSLNLPPTPRMSTSTVFCTRAQVEPSITLVRDASPSLSRPPAILAHAIMALRFDSAGKGHYLYQIKEQMLLLREDDESGVRSEAAVRKLKTVLAKKIRGKFALDLKLLKQDPIKAGGPSDKFRTKSVASLRSSPLKPQLISFFQQDSNRL